MSTSDHRRAFLRRLFPMALCAAFAVLPGAAHGYKVCANAIETEKGERAGRFRVFSCYDMCDNVIETENGERAGRFLIFEYAVVAHALAEKVCGAPAGAMLPKLLKAVEMLGCRPGTPIYSYIKEDITKAVENDLAFTAAGGDPTIRLSPEQVQEYARQAVDVFGGCKELLQMHGTEVHWK